MLGQLKNPEGIITVEGDVADAGCLVVLCRMVWRSVRPVLFGVELAWEGPLRDTAGRVMLMWLN